VIERHGAKPTRRGGRVRKIPLAWWTVRIGSNRPKAMIDAFPATENWQVCAGSDCPRSMIQRFNRGVAAIADGGWVGLTVTSEVSFGVVHHP
jgi:hypothetical protein